jgi:hypothetical protein
MPTFTLQRFDRIIPSDSAGLKSDEWAIEADNVLQARKIAEDLIGDLQIPKELSFCGTHTAMQSGNTEPMPKESQGRNRLSDLQVFVLSNLTAQAKLRADIAWLDTRPRRANLSQYAQRRVEVRAKLAALDALIAARRRQETLRAKGP